MLTISCILLKRLVVILLLIKRKGYLKRIFSLNWISDGKVNTILINLIRFLEGLLLTNMQCCSLNDKRILCDARRQGQLVINLWSRHEILIYSPVLSCKSWYSDAENLNENSEAFQKLLFFKIMLSYSASFP